MSEPQIAYCPNNHIYDRSIHLSCPYCKEIARQRGQAKSGAAERGMGHVPFQEPLARPEDTVSRWEGKVMGWLLCVEGAPEAGRSLELLGGSCHIRLRPGRMPQLCSDDDGADLHIYRDRDTGIFQAELYSRAVTINGHAGSGQQILAPYSKIAVGGTAVVFFPAVGVCGFEWR